MRRSLLVACCSYLLVSCVATYPRPVTTEAPVNNHQYQVDYLFEHEGCKVYRFYDQGNFVYFTNCTDMAVKVTDSTQVINSMRRR